MFSQTGQMANIYRPQRSWGKVMFSQACVILFTGGCLPQCMLGYTHPQSRHPLGADTPPSRHPEQTPPSRHPPGADPPQSRHPWEQTQSPGADTPQEHTHPPGAHPPEQTPPPPPGSRPPPEQTLPPGRRPSIPPHAPEHPGRYSHGAGSTHPTGMQSCYMTVFKIFSVWFGFCSI